VIWRGRPTLQGEATGAAGSRGCISIFFSRDTVVAVVPFERPDPELMKDLSEEQAF
jgi:hypothetical protein